MLSNLDNNNLRIFTWHIHGTYLYYLSKGNYTIYIPVNKKRDAGYYGRGTTFPFGDNVIEIDAEAVKHQQFDCILFQHEKNWRVDQHEILSEAQKRLPRVYVEHDTPLKHPTDTVHPMDDPDVLLVHVSHYNRLMWLNQSRTTKVIEHGVPEPEYGYTGEIERGIVVINHLYQRGRLLGADIFETISREIPLDLVGMGTAEYGGLGEVLHPDLPAFVSRYRFFFSPIRYTSMGLAVCEAMALGMPVVALATTEYSTALSDGVTGYIHTDIDYLVRKMKHLLANHEQAATLGAGAKKVAQKKFSLDRFIREWEETFRQAIASNTFQYEEHSIH